MGQLSTLQVELGSRGVTRVTMSRPEVFNALPEAMRKDVEHKIELLQKELESILERMPKADKRRRRFSSALPSKCCRIWMCRATCRSSRD